MKGILRAVWEAYSVAAAGTGIIVLGVIVAFAASGRLTREKLQAAADALKADPATAEAPAPRRIEAKWREFEISRKQVEADLERRRADLERMNRMADGELKRIEARRTQLDKQIQESGTAADKARRAQETLAAAESDAELKGNVPIFEKMEGAAILSLMQGWGDVRIVRYLRAMKASKAAEVLEAMRTDPQFEDSFRNPLQGAPRGTPTRFDLVMEEFKKVPKAGPE